MTDYVSIRSTYNVLVLCGSRVRIFPVPHHWELLPKTKSNCVKTSRHRLTSRPLEHHYFCICALTPCLSAPLFHYYLSCYPSPKVSNSWPWIPKIKVPKTTLSSTMLHAVSHQSPPGRPFPAIPWKQIIKTFPFYPFQRPSFSHPGVSSRMLKYLKMMIDALIYCAPFLCEGSPSNVALWTMSKFRFQLRRPKHRG